MNLIFSFIPCAALYAALTYSVHVHKWSNILIGANSIICLLLMVGIIYGWKRSHSWQRDSQRYFAGACISVVFVAASYPLHDMWNVRHEKSCETQPCYWTGSCPPENSCSIYQSSGPKAAPRAQQNLARNTTDTEKAVITELNPDTFHLLRE